MVHSAIDHLASCTHWPVGIFVDHAAVGGDGVGPGFVGLMDLPGHRQRLAGQRMLREAIDERLQHVQRLDPAATRSSVARQSGKSCFAAPRRFRRE